MNKTYSFHFVVLFNNFLFFPDISTSSLYSSYLNLYLLLFSTIVLLIPFSHMFSMTVDSLYRTHSPLWLILNSWHSLYSSTCRYIISVCFISCSHSLYTYTCNSSFIRLLFSVFLTYSCYYPMHLLNWLFLLFYSFSFFLK